MMDHWIVTRKMDEIFRTGLLLCQSILHRSFYVNLAYYVELYKVSKSKPMNQVDELSLFCLT